MAFYIKYQLTPLTCHYIGFNSCHTVKPEPLCISEIYKVVPVNTVSKKILLKVKFV